jgi:hypothetical protein
MTDYFLASITLFCSVYSAILCYAIWQKVKDL